MPNNDNPLFQQEVLLSMSVESPLALFGGPKAVVDDDQSVFQWPIIDDTDERAILEVLHNRSMSGTDISRQFEEEFARWHAVKYALCHNNGTAALHGAMFGCEIGVGDEIIAPANTYWASFMPAFSLGATVVFADVDPETLTLDPAEVAARITDNTKAIVPVHSGGMPCDMDPLMELAQAHDLKVIEDVSHAHGGLYKGRMVGTIGDVGAMSIMSGKSLAAGEGGILITDDQRIYERALLFGHYARAGDITLPELTPYTQIGVPVGGYKYRMNQFSSAMARSQFAEYPQRMAEIQKAMNYFCDLLEEVPGVRGVRPAKDSGSTMGGWYAPGALYRPEELGGLPNTRFIEAVSAEGSHCGQGDGRCWHLHPALNDLDIYGHGQPTRLANAVRDVRQPRGSLPVTEGQAERSLRIPWFKRYSPQIIEQHAEAYRKVALHAADLL